jgi:hypothetical protein
MSKVLRAQLESSLIADNLKRELLAQRLASIQREIELTQDFGDEIIADRLNEARKAITEIKRYIRTK